MKESIIVDITNQGKVIFKSGGTIEELIQKIDGPNTIIAALIDNEVQELSYRIKDDTKLTFIHINERMGAKIYRSGLKFLYIAAIKELYGANTNVELKHSLDKGIYTRIDLEITEKHVEDIKAKMHELSKRNLKIEKLTTNRKEAIKYYESSKEQEKVDIYKQMTRDVVTLYSLLDYYGYYYSKMPISTGILNNFDLTLTNDKGIILQYPNTHDGIIPPYTHMEDVLNVFKSYGSWSTRLGVNYVSEVNNIIINGKIKEFIQLNEIRQNEDLQTIAYEIKTKINELKLVLIAGP